MIQLHIIRTNDFQEDFEKYLKFDEIFKCLFDDEAIDTAIILQEFSRDFCKIILEKYNNAKNNVKNNVKKNIRKNKYLFSWSEKNIYKDFLNFDKNYERYPINFFKNIIYVVLKQLQERNALKYSLSWGINEENFKISCDLDEIERQISYCQDMIEAYNRMQNLNYLLKYGKEYKKIFKN